MSLRLQRLNVIRDNAQSDNRRKIARWITIDKRQIMFKYDQQFVGKCESIWALIYCCSRQTGTGWSRDVGAAQNLATG